MLYFNIQDELVANRVPRLSVWRGLDPFMGGGSTAEAAKRLGRKFIGVELEERWAQIAVKRLRQEVLAL